jgi:error-prone DNA polymerase
MVKGLAEVYAATLITRRGEVPYRSVEDVWRRTAVPIAALEQLRAAPRLAWHRCCTTAKRA